MFKPLCYNKPVNSVESCLALERFYISLIYTVCTCVCTYDAHTTLCANDIQMMAWSAMFHTRFDAIFSCVDATRRRNVRVMFRSQEHPWRINEMFANAAPISSFDSFAFRYARGISPWIRKKSIVLTQFRGRRRCRVWIYYTYARVWILQHGGKNILQRRFFTFLSVSSTAWSRLICLWIVRDPLCYCIKTTKR